MNLWEIRATPERLARERRRPWSGEVEMRTLDVGASVAPADWVIGQTPDPVPADDRSGGAVADGAEARVIRGTAAVFGQAARIWDFDEVIRAGAFTKTLQESRDVFGFWAHDSARVFASLASQTLELMQTDRALEYVARLGETEEDRFILDRVARGIVQKTSFGFEVVKEMWTERADGPDLREILEVKLYEISPVPIPAYDGTETFAEDSADDVQRGEPRPASHSGAVCARYLAAELELEAAQNSERSDERC